MRIVHTILGGIYGLFAVWLFLNFFAPLVMLEFVGIIAVAIIMNVAFNPARL